MDANSQKYHLIATVICAISATAGVAYPQASETDALTSILKEMQNSETNIGDVLTQIRTASEAYSVNGLAQIHSVKLSQLCVRFEELVSGMRIIENPDGTKNNVETVVRFEDGDRFLIASRVREFREVPISANETEVRSIAASSISVGNARNMYPNLRLMPEKNGICWVVAYLDESSGSKLESRYTEKTSNKPSTTAENISESSSTVLFYVVLESADVQKQLIDVWRDLVAAAVESAIDAKK
jgi:hypothetical protein